MNGVVVGILAFSGVLWFLLGICQLNTHEIAFGCFLGVLAETVARVERIERKMKRED